MDKTTGKVWLVGAGPSDTGLLTVKGRQIIQSAEVVVYDKLVGISILSSIPVHAECIDVGKIAGKHPVPQDEINEILLREALKGKRVVRLKGGDPFLFGRGGEELQLLSENNIPFEVVPGITSAISVPAYAGIPVTHRDFCSSVHVITGHTKSAGQPDIDFEALVRLNGTLIFLMGVASLHDICRGLINEGIDPNKPAAVLQSGTTARQKKVISTVADLFADAEKAEIKTPAIIVVGDVCSLSREFEWYSCKPLSGVRVVITRQQSQSSSLCEKLYALGAEVIEYPCITTELLEDKEPFRHTMSEIEKYSHVIFTSPVGVTSFFKEISNMKSDIRILAGRKVAAVGTATAAEIEKRGLFVDFVPSKFCGETLARELSEMLEPQDRVLLLRAQEGAEDLVRGFDKLNVQYDEVAIYKTVVNTEHLSAVTDFIREGEADYVAFTSASTVKGFIAALGDMDYSDIKAICIGDMTAREARKYNMQVAVSEEATIDSMIDKIKELSGE